MSKSNKYHYNINKNDSDWSVQIIRRVTSKKTVVSKEQGDFSSEAEAEQWAQKELDSFLQNLKNSNKRHSSQRQQKANRIKAKAEAGSK